LAVYDSLNNFFNCFKTYDPFKVCEEKGISVLIEPLGTVQGYYCMLRSHQFIFVSSQLDNYAAMLVCAHELGHALLHPEINLFYTIFPIGRYERQANDFAVNMLLRGAKEDYPDFDIYQLAQVAGIPKHLLESAFEHVILN
jgi:Zn-dependent peptidase ImmA (M78 family)